jgi:hypothetical protein
MRGLSIEMQLYQYFTYLYLLCMCSTYETPASLSRMVDEYEARAGHILYAHARTHVRTHVLQLATCQCTYYSALLIDDIEYTSARANRFISTAGRLNSVLIIKLATSKYK